MALDESAVSDLLDAAHTRIVGSHELHVVNDDQPEAVVRLKDLSGPVVFHRPGGRELLPRLLYEPVPPGRICEEETAPAEDVSSRKPCVAAPSGAPQASREASVRACWWGELGSPRRKTARLRFSSAAQAWASPLRSLRTALGSRLWPRRFRRKAHHFLTMSASTRRFAPGR